MKVQEGDLINEESNFYFHSILDNRVVVMPKMHLKAFTTVKHGRGSMIIWDCLSLTGNWSRISNPNKNIY